MGLKVSPVTGASVSETVRVQDTIIPVWLSAMKADAEAGAADDLANRVSYLFLGYAANVSAYKLLFAVAPVGSALTVVITKGTVSTIGDTIATLTIPDGASGFLSGTIGGESGEDIGASEVLHFFITSVGSTTPGQGIQVELTANAT